MRISDWSSDVCSSDLKGDRLWLRMEPPPAARTSDGSWSILVNETRFDSARLLIERERGEAQIVTFDEPGLGRNWLLGNNVRLPIPAGESRSEEHTSELQSLMRTSYAVFCLKQKKSCTWDQFAAVSW